MSTLLKYSKGSNCNKVYSWWKQKKEKRALYKLMKHEKVLGAL